MPDAHSKVIRGLHRQRTGGILIEGREANVAQLKWGCSIFLWNFTQSPRDRIQRDFLSPAKTM